MYEEEVLEMSAMTTILEKVPEEAEHQSHRQMNFECQASLRVLSNFLNCYL